MPLDFARILLVEDNLQDQQFMNACIADHGGPGLELVHVSSLLDAGVQLKRQDYQLVITDLNLPDGRGLETFRRVKEMAPDAAVVVVSGMDDPELAIEAVRAGAQDFLVKGDLQPERVGRSLSNAMLRHGQLKQLSSDTVDLRKKNNSLKEMVYVDPLTGLFNRRGLQKALRNRRAPERGRSDAILLVDVDNFKRINDFYGYREGDLALREIGRRIRLHARPGDVGARVGGDEFLVVLKDVSHAGAQALAEEMRQSVAQASLDSAKGIFKVTVSIGVEMLGCGSVSVDEVVQLGHAPLRASKGSGRNRVSAGPDPLQKVHAPPPSLVLRRPFYEMRNGGLAGYRFMIDARVAAPADAIEEEGLLRELLAFAELHGEGLECHLQLSYAQFLLLQPEEMLRACGHGLKSHRLRFFLDAVPLSPVPPGFVDAARRLRDGGWGLGLSGVDLGENGWSNLLQMEPNVVCLEPSLVSGCGRDSGRLHVLTRFCRALTALGAYVLADGVSSSEDQKALHGLSVPFGAGAYLEAAAREMDAAGILV